MNTARKGNRAENAVTNWLTERGWLVGNRRHIAGAGDLLALRGPLIHLIETKGNKGSPWENFRPDDRKALLEMAKEHEVFAMLAWWPPGQDEPTWLPPAQWPD